MWMRSYAGKHRRRSVQQAKLRQLMQDPPAGAATADNDFALLEELLSYPTHVLARAGVR